MRFSRKVSASGADDRGCNVPPNAPPAGCQYSICSGELDIPAASPSPDVLAACAAYAGRLFLLGCESRGVVRLLYFHGPASGPVNTIGKGR